MRLIATLLLTALLFGAAGNARQAGDRLTLSVTETLGQRRFGYPVTAHVPLPRGAVTDPAHVALSGETGGPLRGVQYDARSRWPDGSVQWLDVSLNLSPGPLETQKLVLTWGSQVTHPDPGAGVVREAPDSFDIRNVYRLPRSGPNLIESVKYGRREFLRSPARWRVEWNRRGAEPAPLTLTDAGSRMLAPGPVNAVVERTGTFTGASRPLSYRMTVSQPNSKSWFDAALEIENPQRDRLTLTLEAEYLVEQAPVLFDFGVGSWLYGAARADQAAVLFSRADGSWQVAHVPAGSPQRANPGSLYAHSSSDQPRAEGWAHLLDGAQGGRAIAFGSPELSGPRPRYEGSLRVSGRGEASLRWEASDSKIRVRGLFHHVADPVHVSAVTSPAAMLHPLQVSLPAKWRRRCGLSAREAPAP